MTESVNDIRRFRMGDCVVDPEAGLVLRGGNEYRLEPRSMDVLVYLSKRPMQVVSREELESGVWIGRVVSYDALTTAMLKLRRVLGDDARSPRYIETVSKRGYRLIAEVRPADGDDGANNTDERDGHPWAGRWGLRPVVISLLMLALTAGAALSYISPWWRSGGMSSPALAEHASIAVLPFINLSEDPAQEYFADGMTDDLITALARHPDLLVIARDSVFFYKHEPVDLAEVADKLRVRYILRGSVRRTGGSVRINAQLVDTESGVNLWAERYDGSAEDIFALQDAINRRILTALEIRLERGGSVAKWAEADIDPKAYDYFLHGRNRFFRYASKAENQKARALYAQAVELDPKFAMAYAMLAWTYAFEAMNGWSSDRDASLSQAMQIAGKAIALDDALPVAYFVTGLVYRERGEYIKARAEAEKALALEPSYANAHILLATLLYYTGEPEAGLIRVEQAMRLNPHHPYNYPFHLGQAYFILGRYAESIDAFKQGLDSNPSSERLRVWLAAAYARAGQTDNARWEAEQVFALNPDFSPQRIRAAFPFRDPEDLDRFMEGLRIAGLIR